MGYDIYEKKKEIRLVSSNRVVFYDEDSVLEEKKYYGIKTR